MKNKVIPFIGLIIVVAFIPDLVVMLPNDKIMRILSNEILYFAYYFLRILFVEIAVMWGFYRIFLVEKNNG